MIDISLFWGYITFLFSFQNVLHDFICFILVWKCEDYVSDKLISIGEDRYWTIPIYEVIKWVSKIYHWFLCDYAYGWCNVVLFCSFWWGWLGGVPLVARVFLFWVCLLLHVCIIIIKIPIPKRLNSSYVRNLELIKKFKKQIDGKVPN